MDQLTSYRIELVWANNLDREFRRINEAIKSGKYKRATLDTEFKLGHCPNSRTHPRYQSTEERYIDIKIKVDGGSIRQLGLTLSGDDGTLDLVWQFHFWTNHLTHEIGAAMEPEMIDNHNLIHYEFFTELLITSNLLWNPDISWVFFHSAYDVAFFMKLSTFWNPLPHSVKDFSSGVQSLLGDGRIYDIKYLTRFTDTLFGGLADVSASLGVQRIVGEAHEAGSDSLLTAHTFVRLIDWCFPIDHATKHAGILYGIHAVF